MRNHKRPVGQAVKTPPSHGGIRGSIPLRVTKYAAHLRRNKRRICVALLFNIGVNKMANIDETEIHGYMPSDYVLPENPLIRERLEWFSDQKLALMMHWGPYVQLGIYESWPLVDIDRSWTRSQIDWIDDDDDEFKRQYMALDTTFNPIKFMPDLWADIAAENGFKYFIFTTKHHDGFCMWDTQFSDYKITSPRCPFSRNKNADIVRCLFDAFREKNLGIAAYFSKADWHSPFYWDNYGIGYETSRNPSYDTVVYPEKWEEFVRFTKNQIMELIQNYGRIDILWLDAGQVNRKNKQDIHIEDIIKSARKIQPWLISADRTVGGECENYITPEQTVPPQPLSVPWESCITMGTGFSYRYDDTYKSARTLIHLLLDIIAKGGNLALNISPAPDGHIPKPAIKHMKEMGSWLKANGEGVYCTRPVFPYKNDNFVFTEKNGICYSFLMYGEDEKNQNDLIEIPVEFESIKSITHIGSDKVLEFTINNKKPQVKFPMYIERDKYADLFKIEK